MELAHPPWFAASTDTTYIFGLIPQLLLINISSFCGSCPATPGRQCDPQQWVMFWPASTTTTTTIRAQIELEI